MADKLELEDKLPQQEKEVDSLQAMLEAKLIDEQMQADRVRQELQTKLAALVSEKLEMEGFRQELQTKLETATMVKSDLEAKLSQQEMQADRVRQELQTKLEALASEKLEVEGFQQQLQTKLETETKVSNYLGLKLSQQKMQADRVRQDSLSKLEALESEKLAANSLRQELQTKLEANSKAKSNLEAALEARTSEKTKLESLRGEVFLGEVPKQALQAKIERAELQTRLAASRLLFTREKIKLSQASEEVASELNETRTKLIAAETALQRTTRAKLKRAWKKLWA
jgi:hypothetical protein